MPIHHSSNGGICVDQVYHVPEDICTGDVDPLMEGFAGDHGTHDAMISNGVNAEVLTESGLYIIVRLDTTVNLDALPRIMWWGMVDIDDDSVGIHPGRIGSTPAPSVPRLTTWPPKN